jgi:hypothetical protein
VQEAHLDQELSAYYNASFGEFMECKRKPQEAKRDVHSISNESFSAGAVFWGMALPCWASSMSWSISWTLPRQTVLRWNNAQKVVTLTLTEAVNYSVHGISSPLGVTFALGGTLLNAFMVMFIVPIWCRLSNLERN